MQMRKDCIIFDMDGTLADTLPLTLMAFSELTPQFGLCMPDVETVRRAVGYATSEFYFRIFPECDPSVVRAFGNAVEQREQELAPDYEGDFLFSGVRELLNCLVRRGVSVAVASTGSHEHVYSILGHAGVTSLFNPIRCGAPNKTAMLAEIMAGRLPSRFLMVGDMEKDSVAARAVGVTSVGARFGYLGRESRGFDAFIDKPSDLLSFI